MSEKKEETATGVKTKVAAGKETAAAGKTSSASAAETKTLAEEKTAKEGAGAQIMYVGPTLTGIAIQNRVYTKIPDTAAAMIAKEAELGNLFIPVADYPKANRMLREGAGYIYNAYIKALKLKK